MATYKLLTDHYIGHALLQAGTVVSDTGGGAQLPSDFRPTGEMDPLDTDAVDKFYAAGPQIPGKILIKPVTYWKPNQLPPEGYTGSKKFGERGYFRTFGQLGFVLTGLGAHLPFKER